MISQVNRDIPDELSFWVAAGFNADTMAVKVRVSQTAGGLLIQQTAGKWIQNGRGRYTDGTVNFETARKTSDGLAVQNYGLTSTDSSDGTGLKAFSVADVVPLYSTLLESSQGWTLTSGSSTVAKLAQPIAGQDTFELTLFNKDGTRVVHSLNEIEAVRLLGTKGYELGLSANGVTRISASSGNDAVSMSTGNRAAIDTGDGIDTVLAHWANSSWPSLAAGNLKVDKSRLGEWVLKSGAVDLIKVEQVNDSAIPAYKDIPYITLNLFGSASQQHAPTKATYLSKALALTHTVDHGTVSWASSDPTRIAITGQQANIVGIGDVTLTATVTFDDGTTETYARNYYALTNTKPAGFTGQGLTWRVLQTSDTSSSFNELVKNVDLLSQAPLHSGIDTPDFETGFPTYANTDLIASQVPRP